MIWLKVFILNYGLVVVLLFIALFLIYLGINKKSSLVKQICYNLSAVLIALLIYEIYLGFTEFDTSKRPIEAGNAYSKGSAFTESDKTLGYRPSKDSMVINRIRLYPEDSSVIFDAIYTIKNRIRYTPNTNKNSKKYAIFLGGSFMFGEGLNDDETIPYFFNKFSNKEYNILNYAFGGYGTHQALSTVENVLIKDIDLTQSKDITVFYLYIPNHIYRAAGKASWDANGPNYRIEKNQIVRDGNFLDHKTSEISLKYFFMIWHGSSIYKKFFHKFGEVSDYDIRKVGLMMKKMNDLLIMNGIRFSVIIDTESDDTKTTNPIFKLLDNENIPIFNVRDIIKDIDKKKELYHIKGDGHPTKIYNKILAKYLAKKSIKLSN